MLRRPFASSRWQELYRRIREQLSLDERADREAAELLAGLARQRRSPLEELLRAIRGREVVVAGAGNTLEQGLELLAGRLLKAPLVAADGAVSPLLAKGLRPLLVVTDLDGPHAALYDAYQRGAQLAVHAHGDNMPQLMSFVPRLSSFLGTAQVEPAPPPLVNPYGFTDGDRAAYLAYALGARAIYLIGMELKEPPGVHSSMGRRSPAEVSTRLSIARELLSLLAQAGARLYSLGPPPAPGIRKMAI